MKNTLLLFVSVLFQTFLFAQNNGPKLIWGENNNTFGEYAKAYAFGNDVVLISKNLSTTEGRYIVMDENLDTLASKAYTYSEPIFFTEGKAINDSVFAISGTTTASGNQHAAFVLLLDKYGNLKNNFVFDKISDQTDANLEVFNDSTFIFSYSSNDTELTTVMMRLDGSILWTDRSAITGYMNLGDVTYDGGNSILSFQRLNTGSRLVEMDTLGIKQRAVEMDNVTDPRQVCFFQDSIFLLAGPTHNLLLMTMNRSDLSLKILQYWLSNNTWLWSEENYRMVNYLDSSLLMTYGMGFTLELNNEMQIVAEHVDFGAATGLLVMKDTTIRYVQRGPYYGIKSNEVLEPQLAVVKHDTLFTSDVLTNCYSDHQPYDVSDALFYSTSSSFSNNSFSLSTTTGQFMVSNREMNLDDHCVYYLSAVDEETLNASVSLYPNPVSTSLQYSTDYEILELRILNALGQEQRSEIGAYQTINVEALQTGVYFLQLKLETGDWVTKRFVKE